MPNGEVFGVLGVYEDVTERKLAEDALRQSEERFRLVFEKAPIGIMHYDQTGTVTDCNEKFAEIIGAPKEKFIGFNMIRQMRDEKMREAVAASLRGQVGYYEGDYLSVTGGKLTPVRAIYQPIFSPEGAISGGITIFEDITERQRAVSELKLKERLLDSASDSIFLHDLEGNFLYMNEAAYITRWYTKEELLSLGAWALATPEAAVYQDNIRRELWASGELIFESEHRRKDGSVIPVEIFARVLAVEDREMILSIARDITERQQAEEALKESLARVTEVQDGTIEALVTVTEARDPYTAGHQRRVTRLACAMARELGLPADRVAGLRVMGLLHDMGKISIPAEILSKPGKLSHDGIWPHQIPCPGRLRDCQRNPVPLAGGRGYPAAPRADGRFGLPPGTDRPRYYPGGPHPGGGRRREQRPHRCGRRRSTTARAAPSDGRTSGAGCQLQQPASRAVRNQSWSHAADRSWDLPAHQPN